LRVCSRGITDDALRRIAIDQRPQKERMLHAANFVLDGKQHLAVVRIDNVLKAVLMLIALLADQALGQKLAMRARKVVDVNLNVMLVIGLSRPVGLAEEQILPGAGGDAGEAAMGVLERGRLRAHYL